MADDRLLESEILVDSYGAGSALVALAELASPACRIEPQLLRRLRLACLPEADVSIEQELWQSELINARGGPSPSAKGSHACCAAGCERGGRSSRRWSRGPAP